MTKGNLDNFKIARDCIYQVGNIFDLVGKTFRSELWRKYATLLLYKSIIGLGIGTMFWRLLIPALYVNKLKCNLE